MRFFFEQGGAGTRRRTQNPAPGHGEVPDVPGLAGQRAPAGKHLPLADGHGLGREIHLSDLPPELGRRSSETDSEDRTMTGRPALPVGAQRTGQRQAAHPARGVPAFERALIEVALAHTRGRKRDAAELLGWGRNTLTRKMKELEMDD
jgi:hypothetical protein